MTNKAIILGCGDSAGVPSITYKGELDWGFCDPQNPKNSRLRPSLYVEYKGLRLVIDTGPDFRQQYIQNHLSGIDAVLLTHAHSDHIVGLDELRQLYFSNGHQSIPAYMTKETFDDLQGSFHYLFHQNQNHAIYPQILKAHCIDGDFIINNHRIGVYSYDHGNMKTVGFRFGDLAYMTDFKTLSASILDQLKGIKIWIVDCVASDGPRPTHSHLEQTLDYINSVKPETAILTHMGKTMDYDRIQGILPHHIQVGYDGLTIQF